MTCFAERVLIASMFSNAYFMLCLVKAVLICKIRI